MNRRIAMKQLSGLASAFLLTATRARARSLDGGNFDTAGFDLDGQTAPVAPVAAASAGPFTLPPLPYAYDALEPYFDAETMQLHHDKHHQAYVDRLNATVAGHPEVAGKNLHQLIENLGAVPEPIRMAVRNFGGGHVNHSFLWPTLGKGGAAPTGELGKAIDAKFGSLSTFQDKLTAAANGVFGSGWAWLVTTPDGLEIETTPNQDSPLSVGHTPVLGVDVWEHAYYLKYKNVRANYVKAYFSVVNWDAVSAKYASEKKA